MENITEIQKLASQCLNCKTKPCTKGCPLGNDIPTFINYVKNGDLYNAYLTLNKTTIMPSICGRICPHSKQCQGNCVRSKLGAPVQIGRIEAFVGDYAIKNNYKVFDKIHEKNGKKVAIVGSGPSGLTCATWLAKYGYDVTIFEKERCLGGILTHGIPDFRLNKNLVKTNINRILGLGIKFKTSCSLGKNFSIDYLLKHYDYIYLALGANKPLFMGIDGENSNNVFGANDLLKYKSQPNFAGKTVCVIGGGNVAIDMAVTAKKCMAKNVYVIYRRSRAQMPAEPKEIENAIFEGVEFLFQTNILKILSKNNYVSQIECIKTELVSSPNSTRKVPINIENSNFLLNTDYVIMAIGSQTDLNTVNKLNLSISEKGYIKTDEKLMTSNERVFAGGDLIGTAGTVAWASRNGKDAANQIYSLKV